MKVCIQKMAIAMWLPLALLGCSDAQSVTPDDMLVGADRDAQGCIASAGYQWSKVAQECVRLWEVGTELTHQGSGDPAYSAYAVIDGDQAELFLPEEADSLLLQKTPNVSDPVEWAADGVDYVLSYDPFQAMILLDAQGFVMYRDDAATNVPPPFVEHSADEMEAEITVRQGTVVRVEDGAYPMFTLHLQTTDPAERLSLSLMAEGAVIEGATLADLDGRTVTVHYEEVESWDLMAIDAMGSDGLTDTQIGEGWHFVSGRLRGAETISMGDLPDTVTIDTISGDPVSFETFIEEDLVALNDSDVSAWLAPRQTKNVLLVEAVTAQD
jgi:hypothetical protein